MGKEDSDFRGELQNWNSFHPICGIPISPGSESHLEASLDPQLPGVLVEIGVKRPRWLARVSGPRISGLGRMQEEKERPRGG